MDFIRAAFLLRFQFLKSYIKIIRYLAIISFLQDLSYAFFSPAELDVNLPSSSAGEKLIEVIGSNLFLFRYHLYHPWMFSAAQHSCIPHDHRDHPFPFKIGLFRTFTGYITVWIHNCIILYLLINVYPNLRNLFFIINYLNYFPIIARSMRMQA